jgi:hypothetical protein
MTDPDFPEALRSFIRDHIPDVDAAEVLLLLARNRDRRFAVRAIVDETRHAAVSEAAIRRHLALFRERGLIVEMNDDTFQYYPVVPQLDPLIAALTKAYNERPVTMVRMIYELKDEKIRSFADAFRLKKQ